MADTTNKINNITLQERLKSHTQGLHQELEQFMHVTEIMNQTLTLAQYKNVLLTNYQVHHLYEALIYDQIIKERSERINLKERIKLESLKADLVDVGIDEPLLEPIHNTAELMEVPNEAFALGAMYVLEGATLGGHVIQKQLRKNSNFPNAIKLNYYNCYGKQLIEKWQQFVLELNSLPAEQHEHAERGAVFMFLKIMEIAKEFRLN